MPAEGGRAALGRFARSRTARRLGHCRPAILVSAVQRLDLRHRAATTVGWARGHFIAASKSRHGRLLDGPTVPNMLEIGPN